MTSRAQARIPTTWWLVGATLLVGIVAGILQITLAMAVPWLLGGLAVGIAGWRLVRMLLDIRAQRWGMDVLAILAVVSTLIVAEYWAAWVITLMMTGGSALEDAASRRAHRELRLLLARAPRRAMRIDAAGAAHEVDVESIAVGDVILVRPGDLVPVDADLLDERAEFDLSSITGESLPETVQRGERVPSGAVTLVSPVRLRSAAPAAASEYQRIVGAVERAAGSRSRFARLSDRIAVPFTALALLIAGLAWLLSGEFLRFAEVLVVATPCPLLIAAPAAFVAGMGRAAKAGVVLKNAEALERIADARSVALDKTGTLTGGAPAVDRVEAVDPATGDQVLALAAAVEASSSHALAAAIVAAAEHRGLARPELASVQEHPGEGMTARVEGEELRVGQSSFAGVTRTSSADGVGVEVVLGGRPLGRVVLRDPVRAEAPSVIAGLRAAGVERIVMVTGDDEQTARGVAAEIGVSEVHAALRPEQKAEVVAGLRPRQVVMVGEGINDVLVLASADVGVAINRAGLGAAGESADAVILSERLGSLLDVRHIARRTRRIARQSVWLGVGVSLALMILATTGVLPPVPGAVAQEAVDVLTILNALRATRTRLA